MAVRGIAGFLLIFPQLTPPGTLPLYTFQNYFPDPTSDGLYTYDYRAFSVSPLLTDRNSTSHDFSLTFPATAANVDLIDACLTNRYTITTIIYTWSAVENIEAPTEFIPFAAGSGDAVSATADISTVTLQVRPYADAIDQDLPWRKVAWTILGPLSLDT